MDTRSRSETTPKTVLLVHNRYQQFGGEDAVFEAESRLLEQHGHRVHRLIVDNRHISEPSLVEAVSLAGRTIWSVPAARLLRARVRSVKPDIVHVHNFVPLLSPAIYAACASEGAAVVQTLHNYRLICPAATLYRDGHPCEDCVGRSVAWPGIVHSCYRDSIAATAAVAGMLAVHRLRGTWQRDVDAFIAVSEFLGEKMVEGGFARERIHVKTNFVEPDPGPRAGPGDAFLFLGRLNDQKGLGTLLASWEAANLNARLRIVGEGPMEADARTSAARVASIEVIGPRPHEDVFAELRAARALVFPSRSYEAGFPMSILEAYACGLPVIASRLGNMAEIVQDGVTGLLFRPGDARDLAAKMQWALDHPVELDRMGKSARQVYEQRFTPGANYERLVEIYRDALRRRASRGFA